MKKLFAFVLIFAAGFFVSELLRDDERTAQAGQGCAKLRDNGSGVIVQDMNGDGEVFRNPIADALWLLNWHFSGGPAPVPPCEVNELAQCREALLRRIRLPATGQTTCYDQEGEVVPCDSGICPGQDGYYQLGYPPEERFVDNSDSTVTDLCTGLMWQKETADTNEDGSITANDSVIWCDALQHCDSLILCEDDTWTTNPDDAEARGGVKYDDWRLPNVKELASIVHCGRTSPSTDDAFLFGPGNWYYWTSTSGHRNPRRAATVNFVNGLVSGGHPYVPEPPATKNELYYVRAIRTIQPGE